MMQIQSKYARFTETAGKISILACCFTIPFSTSMSGTTAILVTVFWFLSGKFLQLPKQMRDNPPVLFCIALLLLMCASLLYTPVPLDDAVSYLKKYRELLYFAVVISFMSGDRTGSARAENCFLSGCTVLMLISYGIFFQLIPSERYGYSIVYHITHSFFMAILAFWCLQKIVDFNKHIYLWAILFLLASGNLFYVTPGRTGMLVYVVLICLLLTQRFSCKKCVLAFFVLAALAAGTYLTSSNLSTRIEQAVHEMQHYQAEKSRTSLGMRFDWWGNSIELIKQRPILGHGAGSFEKVQGDLIRNTRTKPTDNPHNEYLLISVQTGITGLMLFLGILVSLTFGSFKLPPQKRYLLQGVVVAMATGCIMNSLLFDSLQGHFFAFLSGVLYSEVADPKDSAARKI